MKTQGFSCQGCYFLTTPLAERHESERPTQGPGDEIVHDDDRSFRWSARV